MRVFVFREAIEVTRESYTKAKLYAIPEDKITLLETYDGSHNVYCKINGLKTDCSFDQIVNLLGERIDVVPYGTRNL